MDNSANHPGFQTKRVFISRGNQQSSRAERSVNKNSEMIVNKRRIHRHPSTSVEAGVETVSSLRFKGIRITENLVIVISYLHSSRKRSQTTLKQPKGKQTLPLRAVWQKIRSICSHTTRLNSTFSFSLPVLLSSMKA